MKWPNKGTVLDYITAFAKYIDVYVCKSDTYLVFDRYHEMSTKEIMRRTRAGKEASRKHRLSLSTPLPSKKIILTVTSNKSQLIDLICQFIFDNMDGIGKGNKLVVTGSAPVPKEVCKGTLQPRPDLYTTHEEADVIVVQQVCHLTSSGKVNITDDSDIFVLLLHGYNEKRLTCHIVMAGSSPSRSSSDIKANAEKHPGILQDLLPAHILTGCDTVSYLWGIGKITAIKVLKSGLTLRKLGCVDEAMNAVVAEATKFIVACYGFPGETTMTALQLKVWTSKMGNLKLNTSPELRSLPPTSDVFEEHVYRAHLQTAIWRLYAESNPPQLNPIHCGWRIDGELNMLVTIAMPPDVSPVPLNVLKLIKCGCASCITSRCSCASAQLSCSVFCKCSGSNCRNPHTLRTMDAEENIVDEEC